MTDRIRSVGKSRTNWDSTICRGMCGSGAGIGTAKTWGLRRGKPILKARPAARFTFGKADAGWRRTLRALYHFGERIIRPTLAPTTKACGFAGINRSDA